MKTSTFKTPDDLWKVIEKKAKKLNISKSEVIKRILIKDLIK